MLPSTPPSMPPPASELEKVNVSGKTSRKSPRERETESAPIVNPVSVKEVGSRMGESGCCQTREASTRPALSG